MGFPHIPFPASPRSKTKTHQVQWDESLLCDVFHDFCNWNSLSSGNLPNQPINTACDTLCNIVKLDEKQSLTIPAFLTMSRFKYWKVLPTVNSLKTRGIFHHETVILEVSSCWYFSRRCLPHHKTGEAIPCIIFSGNRVQRREALNGMEEVSSCSLPLCREAKLSSSPYKTFPYISLPNKGHAHL